MTCFAVDSRTLSVWSAQPLPADNTVRWSIDRKLRLVAAWHYGQASIEEVARRWRIEAREFLEWLLAFDVGGKSALRTTQPNPRAIVWQADISVGEEERRIVRMLQRYSETRSYAAVAREFCVSFATAQHDVSRARSHLRRMRRKAAVREHKEART